MSSLAVFNEQMLDTLITAPRLLNSSASAACTAHPEHVDGILSLCKPIYQACFSQADVCLGTASCHCSIDLRVESAAPTNTLQGRMADAKVVGRVKDPGPESGDFQWSSLSSLGSCCLNGALYVTARAEPPNGQGLVGVLYAEWREITASHLHECEDVVDMQPHSGLNGAHLPRLLHHLA